MTMNAINPEQFTVLEVFHVFNQKVKGDCQEKKRYSTITCGVLTRYRWENTTAVKAGGVETIIALTPGFRFIPLYKVGDSEFWTSTPRGISYGRYEQAQEWLRLNLEEYEEE